MSQIDEIRDKTDIVELISSLGVNLRKTGRSFVGFCPFHPNSRTPAFTVYPESNSFYCFGCHASGTAFDFVMRKQGLDFRGALELLAARAGVRLAPRSDEERHEDARRVRLIELNRLAAKVFHHLLVETQRGEAARAYVAKRELSAEIVAAFQLGYSPDEWGFLFAYLTEKKGYAPEEVEAAGLAIRHESGHYYDRFRGRLIFPIRNAKGEVVGFGGRALGDAQPKYLNTPETLLYKKGDLLYGLDLAREAIRVDDRTVVVEGYIDVITAHQHGFRNVVAPLGTALTRSHVALLKRLSHNVYLALDADAAGQRATLKGLDALRESADEGGHLVATAQGTVRLESDVNLRIIRMPTGQDPDEVIRGNPELWKQLVADAAPVMEFYLGAYTTGLDLKRPEDQRTALDRLLPLIAELDGAQQRVYISRVEQVVGIRAELILDLLRTGSGRRPGAAVGRKPGPRGPRKPGEGSRPAFQVPAKAPLPPSGDEAPHPAAAGQPQPPAQARRTPQQLIEGYLLALALRHPTVEAAVEALLEEGLARHPAMRELFGGGLADLIEDPIYQEIWHQFSILPPGWRPASAEELAGWGASLDEQVREQALQLITTPAAPHDFRYRQEAEGSARKLRLEQISRLLGRLNERARETTTETEFDEVRVLYSKINDYRATLLTPKRSSTFNDLRNLTGPS